MAINDEGGNGFYMPVAPACAGGEGGSYARDGRGRGSNARRDSMGRYSSRMDGYSRHGDVVESLREVMEEAPDDRTRMEIQRLIEKMEQR